jgi:uncharacterized membrane protein YgaE (UPF0421/DUF939 family)
MNPREAIRTAVLIAFVTLSSFVCGVYFTSFFHHGSAGLGGLWAVMSGNVVLQVTRRKTWSSAWLQILGTFVGAIVSAAYLSVLPFSIAGMAGAVFVTVIVCHVFRIPDHARLAALAVSVVVLVSSFHPTLHPVLNSALRLAEACIGTAMAAFAALVWPEPREVS